MASAREQQARMKLKALADAAAADKAEFERVRRDAVAAQQAKAAADRVSAEAARQHAEELRRQIAEKEAAAATSKAQAVAEAEARRAADLQEAARIEAVRQRKLDELRAQGVPAAYTSSLARKNFSRGSM